MFSGFITATLAIGIGATIAIFGVFNWLVLNDLPVKRPEELLQVVPRSVQGNGFRYTYDLFQEFLRTQSTFEEVYGADMPTPMELVTSERRNKVQVQLVSGSYFNVLGVSPHIGRVLEQDDELEIQAAAVMSYAYWSSKLGRNPAILGQYLVINEVSILVVGVAQQRFSGDAVGDNVDLWVPLSLRSRLHKMLGSSNADSSVTFIHVIGRNRNLPEAQVKAGISANLEPLKEMMKAQSVYDGEKLSRLDLLSASRGLSRWRAKFSLPVKALGAMVGILLLLSCLNAANLLFARSVSRNQEFSTRLALGASGGHLLRLLTMEYMLLACIGGLAGIVVSFWLRSWLVASVGTLGGPPLFDVSVDARVLMFGFLLTILSACVFGLGPVWRISRMSAMPGLTRGSGQREKNRSSKAVMIGQVALSSLLLFLGGLFVSTVRNLERVDAGFARNGVVQLTISFPAGEDDFGNILQIYSTISRELEALPGVRRASFAWWGLVSGGSSSLCCVIPEGESKLPEEGREVAFNLVTPGYFESIGARFLAGRDFNQNEMADADLGVAIINETMAKDLFGERPAIGRQVRFLGTGRKDLEVVGVVGDAKYYHLRDSAESMLFLSPAPYKVQLGHLFIRTHGDSTSVVSPALQVIETVNPGLSIPAIDSIESLLERDISQERLVAKLGGVFGILALLLTGVGLYGAIFYKVVLRAQEIGIRMAMGAQRHHVLWLVVRETFLLLGIGSFIGLSTALISARLVAKLLYGMSPNDPGMVVFTLIIMSAVALSASIVPCLRALSVDPHTVLRSE